MPEDNHYLMGPQPGQVEWTDDIMEMIANPREGGRNGVHGKPQQEHGVTSRYLWLVIQELVKHLLFIALQPTTSTKITKELLGLILQPKFVLCQMEGR